MKRLFAILLVLAAAWSPLPPAHAWQPLTIGTTVAPPLSMPDSNGMLDRLLREAFLRIGIGVQFVTLPSERSLAEANSGGIDGDNNRIAGLARNYPELIQVPESNMVYEFTAFALDPSVVVNDWESLAKYSVGYIQGWKILDENVKAVELTKVATPQQLFSLLKAKRVDVIIYERFGGEHFIQELDVQGARVLQPPLARREMFLYLNRKHAPVVEYLAKALRDMKADGSYQAVFGKASTR
ncbi:MAG: substrate-binding periplasmic protein [Acidobacteriota bacterium]